MNRNYRTKGAGNGDPKGRREAARPDIPRFCLSRGMDETGPQR